MKITGIILNTFRESVRDKVFITIIIFAILVIGSGRVIKPLALGEEAKVVKDIGLNAITFFSVLIAILVGGRLVYKEIEKRTIYLILSRPIPRWQFVLGKYLGLLLVLFESLLIMTGAFYIIMFLLNIPSNVYLLWAILMTFCQLWILTAIAILFSTFSTPITSSIFTFAIYVMGHLTRDLKVFAKLSKSPINELFANIIYYVLPNFSNFNIKSAVVHNLIIETNAMLLTILYAIFYSALMLFIASQILARKDF